MPASWKVVWVDRHETDIPTVAADPERQRAEVWAHLKTLGVTREQVVAFYQHTEHHD